MEKQKETFQNIKNYKCYICDKNFQCKKYLAQHMLTHQSKQKCDECGAAFSFPSSLKRHERTIHDKKHVRKASSYTCTERHKSFKRQHNPLHHSSTLHQRTNKDSLSCQHCHNEFETYQQLVDHIEQHHPLKQVGGKQQTKPKLLKDNTITSNESDLTRNDAPTKSQKNLPSQSQKKEVHKNLPSQTQKKEASHSNDSESALRRAVENRHIYPRQNERYDMLPFFANTREEIVNYLRSRVSQVGGIKWNLCVEVEMQRDDGHKTTISTPFFRSRTYRLLESEELQDHDMNEAFQKMFAGLEKYQREGSNWFVKKIIKLEIHTVIYRPISGSSYIPLPKTLSKSHCVLNIQNRDDKCFLYCVLASIHPQKEFSENPELYIAYEKELLMTGIQYPVTIASIPKFEKQNENISINVFSFDDGSIVPMRITNYTDRLHHVNLLWLKTTHTSHYCLITNLNRFLSRSKTCRNQAYFCPYCLHGFTREDLLLSHKDNCSTHGPQRVILPTSEKDSILKFTEYEKMLQVPFTVYADFETVNEKLHTCMPNPSHASTTPTAKLSACGFAYKVVCEDSRYTKPTVVYRGPNASVKLIERLLEEEKQIQEILSHIEPMPEHEGLIDNAKQCCLCKKEFTLYDKTYKKVVAHHNHLTGEIIGAACNSCNLNCKQSKKIPIFLHNLHNFDAHLLCSEGLGRFSEYRLSCIPQTSERYVSFSLGNLRFLDSFQFLPSSLETLVDNLKQDGIDAFPHLLSEFRRRDQAELLIRKGVYPYEYMDAFHRFEEKELPPIQEFYSSIKKGGISDDEYAHAQRVFAEFNMSSLGDYHDLYVKTDVLLLADVFESFRKVCLSQYELDPCHFYTSPGLAWSSLLKMTGIELELLADIDQLLMIEAGTRGGLSQISNRYQKANNQYLKNHDSSDTTSYLMYLDANNLYGWAMIQPLPIGNFRFLDDVTGFDVMTVKEDGDIGYILDVSLHYPPELHDLHNCLPLAPEQKLISNEEHSPYAQQLLRRLHGLNNNDPLPSRGRVKKLLATLGDKSNYILHYRNLQLYVKLGMKIKEIHRILQFRQSPWMKPYIDFNTEMRKRAKSTFEKNFWKLMNVSVFGKTLQNERKYKNIELVHLGKRLRKLSAKPTYKNTTIFNEDLVAVELLRSQVKLFKPSYCGMCILDLSKCLMYDFWYGYIKKRYGNKAQLQMTDTDSFLFYCETDDIYEDLLLSKEFFDTSDYPVDHVLHSDYNKKVLGKMKDETNGQPISEFIGLRSKMYSFMCNDTEEKRAKGVSRVTVKKDLRHDHYKSTLFEETKTVSAMTALRSHRHELFCEDINKTGLCAFDDKRFLLNAVQSYAYSHYKIRTQKCDNEVRAEELLSDQLQKSPIEISMEEPNTQRVHIQPVQIVETSSIQTDIPTVQMVEVPSIHLMVDPLIFDSQSLLYKEDQSFTLDEFTVTPCERYSNME